MPAALGIRLFWRTNMAWKKGVRLGSRRVARSRRAVQGHFLMLEASRQISRTRPRSDGKLGRLEIRPEDTMLMKYPIKFSISAPVAVRDGKPTAKSSCPLYRCSKPGRLQASHENVASSRLKAARPPIAPGREEA